MKHWIYLQVCCNRERIDILEVQKMTQIFSQQVWESGLITLWKVASKASHLCKIPRRNPSQTTLTSQGTPRQSTASSSFQNYVVLSVVDGCWVRCTRMICWHSYDCADCPDLCTWSIGYIGSCSSLPPTCTGPALVRQHVISYILGICSDHFKLLIVAGNSQSHTMWVCPLDISTWIQHVTVGSGVQWCFIDLWKYCKSNCMGIKVLVCSFWSASSTVPLMT